MKQVLPRFQSPTTPPLDLHTEEEGEEWEGEGEEGGEWVKVPVRGRETITVKNVQVRYLCTI